MRSYVTVALMGARAPPPRRKSPPAFAPAGRRRSAVGLLPPEWWHSVWPLGCNWGLARVWQQGCGPCGVVISDWAFVYAGYS